MSETKTLTDWMDGGRISNPTCQMTNWLLLADGTTLSVQAGRFHYCTPKEDSESNSYDIYTHFEVGYPNRELSLLMPYAEDVDNPTDTVYGYVPKYIIESVVEECGGIVGYVEQKVG